MSRAGWGVGGREKLLSLDDRGLDAVRDRVFCFLVCRDVAAGQRTDGDQAPAPEVVSILRSNTEQLADGNGRERQGEELDEVAFAPRHDVVEQLVGDRRHLWLQSGDGGRQERRAQRAAVACVVGVVGRAEHPGLLVEDSGTVAVVPQRRLLEHVDDVVETAQHVERRIVIGLGVQRAPGAELGVSVERLEGVSRLGVRVLDRHPSGQYVADAWPSGSRTGPVRSTLIFRLPPPSRGWLRSTLASGLEVRVLEVGVEVGGRRPLLVDVDPPVDDRVGGDDVGEAARLVVARRPLQVDGRRDQLVADCWVDVDPAGDDDHARPFSTASSRRRPGRGTR